MRRAAGLSALRELIATRDPDRAELPLHACRPAQGDRHQRAQCACAEDACGVQSFAWTGLRLLLGKAVAADAKDQGRRKKLPDRASLDDQSLIANIAVAHQARRSACSPWPLVA